MPLAQLVGVDVDPDLDAVAELDALGLELLHAPLDDPLLDLEVGDAEAHEPAAGLVALVDGDVVAGRASCCAHASPAGPEPIDGDAPSAARARRGCGTIQPSSQARFTIESSICLIVTASPSLISSTHAASHGAGQRRPVNSGKLFVRWSWTIASRQRSR